MSLADALAFPPAAPSRIPVIDPALLRDSQHVIMQQAEGSQGDSEPKEEVEDQDMGDLFGDDAGTPEPAETMDDDGLTSPERRKRKAMEYEEDDQEEPQEVQLRDASVQIPNIPVPKSSDDNYWVIRMPNFVKLDSKPFHPDTYVGPEQDDDATQQQMDVLKERSLSIKLEVENTVRWRWVKGENGEDRKQSNSRIIRWSDGSLSLQLGKELFDVNHNIDTSASISRSALGGSSGSSQSQSQSLSQSLILPPAQNYHPLRSHGLTYLVAQHKRAEVLQAEKLITGHLTLRPTGMQSETHRKLVRAVGQKHNKVARLRMAPNDLVRRDPDKELAELAKNTARKPRKSSKKTEDELVTPKKRRAGGGKKSREQVWSDDDGEAFVGSEDESEDGLDGRRKVKKKSAPDDLKKGPGEYQTDDFVVSDEEDNEDDGMKSGKKQSVDEEEVKDSLDEAEAKIAKRESKKRKKGHVKEGHIKEEEVVAPKEEPEDDVDDKMEVESEEDDQEVGIRRPPTGGRRRRVAVEEEDEE